jgi:dUTPase
MSQIFFNDNLKSGLSESEIELWSNPFMVKPFMINWFGQKFNEFMLIDIFVDNDDEKLKQMYLQSAFEHNLKIYKNPDTYDAGFDMYIPAEITTEMLCNDDIRVDHQIKCRAMLYQQRDTMDFKHRGTAFYTYARSSVSNTPLRLANNQGIIDAGYRGNLIGKFDIHKHLCHGFNIFKYARLLQICAPGLVPIYVNIVDTIEELGNKTIRGEGGFGSTGV